MKFLENLTVSKDAVPYRLRKGEEPPPGAHFIPPSVVCELHLDRINKWEPKKEVWPLAYGNVILMATTSLSASFIHLKWISLLGSALKIAPLLAVNAGPGVASLVLQQHYVRNEILKGNVRCNICTETRSGLIQAAFGCVAPLAVSTIFQTFEPRKYNILEFVVEQFKKNTAFKRTLGVTLLFHYSLGMLMAGQQISIFDSLLLKEDYNDRPPQEFDG